MHLDLWNPFRFLRKHIGERDGSANEAMKSSARPPETQAASKPPKVESVGELFLPDPVHLLVDFIRKPLAPLGPIESWFGDYSHDRFQPIVDVTEEAESIMVSAELPGMTKEDIELEVVGNFLVLSGQKRFEKKDAEEGCYRLERSFGFFQRAIPLPTSVDLDRIDASMKDGVLVIRVPKSTNQDVNRNRIEIK